MFQAQQFHSEKSLYKAFGFSISSQIYPVKFEDATDDEIEELKRLKQKQRDREKELPEKQPEKKDKETK